MTLFRAASRAERPAAVLAVVSTVLPIVFLLARSTPVAAQLDAEFSLTPTSGISPLTVQCTDLTTGGTPTAWFWEFGDGTTSSETDPAHTYTSPGTYTVALTVFLGLDVDTETKTDLVTVAPADLVADFTVDTTAGVNPLTVGFTNLTTGGPPLAWFWQFGDGFTSVEEHPTHVYTTPGTYTISLDAYLGLQIASVEKVDLIVVEPATLVPDFSATPTTGIAPLTVTFSGSTEGVEPSWWSWDFGDSWSGSGPQPEHTFDEPGSYTVTLTTTFGGQSASVTQTAFITVGDLPTCVAKEAWLATEGTEKQWFGWSVALDDGVAAIGAPRGPGKGFVELIDVLSGERITTLRAPEPEGNDQFGFSVDIDAGLVAVGAIGVRQVHLFDTRGAHLATIDVVADLFGFSVALDGGRLVVGARNDHELGLGAGAAFLLDVSDPAAPMLIEKLVAGNGEDYSYFGSDVAISGDRILVGAMGKNPSDPEAAFLFEIPETGPPFQTGTFELPDDESGGNLGQSVALVGDLALVGAPNGPGSHGKGIVAVLDATTGEQLALLAPPGIPGTADFGTSLAFDGTTALVGAPGGNTDKVFRYDLSDPTAPELIAKLVPQVQDATGEFGSSVAFHEDHAVVGNYEDDDLAFQAGAAYLFPFALGKWTDLGSGLAGAAGLPGLTGMGTLAGTCTLDLALTGAAEGSPTFLVVGFSELSAPFLGGVLIPSPDLVLSGLTDSSGDLLLGAMLPNGLPAGTSLFFQHWIVDDGGPSGFAASNGLRATTP